jgi:hypothetical protein
MKELCEAADLALLLESLFFLAASCRLRTHPAQRIKER